MPIDTFFAAAPIWPALSIRRSSFGAAALGSLLATLRRVAILHCVDAFLAVCQRCGRWSGSVAWTCRGFDAKASQAIGA